MVDRIVTIETRLRCYTELTDYLNEAVTDYERVRRKIWHEMIEPNFKDNYPTDAKFEMHCRLIYGLHSRAINTIVRDVKSEMKRYMRLKETELIQLEAKIIALKKKIIKSIKIIDALKPKVVDNKATDKELSQYRKFKRKLYYQKNRSNKLNNRHNNLQYQIDNKIYSVCYGTKRVFRKQNHMKENHYKTHTKWYNDFVKNRDKNIWLTGSVGEKDGNQMVALSYNEDTDTFSIKLRKIDSGEYGKFDSEKYITYDNITFKHNKQDIIDLVNAQKNNTDNKQGINFRFHRRKTTWYLQIVYTKEFYEAEYVTLCSYGVIGLDFNDGFIQLAETDSSGNLVHRQKYDLKYYGTGNKAETEIEQVLNTIIKYSAKVGKDVAIEDLEFKRTKASQLTATSDKGKDYNRMLHKFDYNRYKSKICDIAFNNKVLVYKVKPHYTTQIAKQKFCPKMKLTSHQGAALVIARSYQGFKDKLKKKTKSKKLHNLS